METKKDNNVIPNALRLGVLAVAVSSVLYSGSSLAAAICNTNPMTNIYECKDLTPGGEVDNGTSSESGSFNGIVLETQNDGKINSFRFAATTPGEKVENTNTGSAGIYATSGVIEKVSISGSPPAIISSPAIVIGANQIGGVTNPLITSVTGDEYGANFEAKATTNGNIHVKFENSEVHAAGGSLTSSAIRSHTTTGHNTITLEDVKLTSANDILLEMTSSATAGTTVTSKGNSNLTGNFKFTGGAVDFQNQLGSTWTVRENSKNTVETKFTDNSSFTNGGTINLDSAVKDATIGSTTGFTFTNSSYITLTDEANGIIDLRGLKAGNTLTIDGDYVSDGGALLLNTMLDGDNSTTDKLVINGNVTTTTQASGEKNSTHVYITKVGGAGAQTGDGIEIITTNGSNDGDFKLANTSSLRAGQYTYNTFERNGDNWYLKSKSDLLNPTSGKAYSPEVGVYLSNQAAAINMFSQTMHDRLGEAQFTRAYYPEDSDIKRASSVWMRVNTNYVTSDMLNDSLSTRTNTYTVQMGSDFARWYNDIDRLHTGFMTAFGESSTTTDASYAEDKATGDVKGYNLGLYATWFGDYHEVTGPYLDVWTQYSDFRNHVTQDGHKERYKSHAWTSSIEGGYALSAYQGEKYQFLIEPQLQMMHIHYSAKDVNNKLTELNVRDPNASGFSMRLGSRFVLRNTLVVNGFQPFAELNWHYSGADNSLAFNGEKLKGGMPENRYEAKVGGQGEVTGGVQVYAHLSQMIGEKSYSRTEGQVGVKVTF